MALVQGLTISDRGPFACLPYRVVGQIVRCIDLNRLLHVGLDQFASSVVCFEIVYTCLTGSFAPSIHLQNWFTIQYGYYLPAEIRPLDQ